MSYTPSSPDATGSGSLTALNQTVVVNALPGHTSWSVQATGTFVGTFQTQITLDGTNWVPVNSRQSGTGALKNTFTTTGVFRGSVGGVFQFRVICTAYSSGTAIVSVRLGSGVGAVFSNSIILIQDQFQYYSSFCPDIQGL